MPQSLTRALLGRSAARTHRAAYSRDSRTVSRRSKGRVRRAEFAWIYERNAPTRVNGKPIVPEDWLPDATRTQVSTGADAGYGYQWWTRQEMGPSRAVGATGR